MGKVSPTCVLVDSAPLNRSFHSRTTTQVRSGVALAPAFLCRGKVLRAAFTRSRCLSFRIVVGSAISLLWLLSSNLRATQCGAPRKQQPTTWNGRSGIWLPNYLVRMACPTAKATRIKLTRPSHRLLYHYNDAISQNQKGSRPRCTQARSLSARDGEDSSRPASAFEVDLDARPCANRQQSCTANRQLIGWHRPAVQGCPRTLTEPERASRGFKARARQTTLSSSQRLSSPTSCPSSSPTSCAAAVYPRPPPFHPRHRPRGH